MKLKRKNLLKMPAVGNSRFLLSLLKVVVHGDIGSSKLTMIGTLLNKISTSYKRDPEIFSIIKAIEISINCKLDDVKDNHLIVSVIEASISNDDNKDILNGLIEPVILGSFKLQESEIAYVLNIISTYSKIGFILEYKDNIIDKFSSIESGSINGINLLVNDFEKEIAGLHVKLHKTLSSDGIDATDTVSISDPEFFKKYFNKVYKLSKRKTKVLKTGIKRFNRFLSDDGGFLTGKMYVVHAPINSFKTGLLLYIVKWIQLYNSDLYLEKFKATGKRPVILFLSLENTWDENTERLFSMYASTNLSEVSNLKDAENIWKSNVYKTDSIIDICMIYGKAGRFSTSDLEYRIDEIESQGNQVIACVIDYMRIMRDDLANTDPRLKVISISTDLHELVALRPEMVLITAHHTNRDGDVILTDVENRGGVDKVKSLGRQHLVEAHAVEDAIDFSMYISPEVSPFTGETFLTFKKGKCRYKRTDIEYFAHELKRKFYFTDDINLDKELSINSIADTANESEKDNTIYSNEIKKTGKKGKTSIRDTDKNNSNIFASVFTADDI